MALEIFITIKHNEYEQVGHLQALTIMLELEQMIKFVFNHTIRAIFSDHTYIVRVGEESYRVFINECKEALAYHFGQVATYDLGHVAKVSYIYDILIFGF